MGNTRASWIRRSGSACKHCSGRTDRPRMPRSGVLPAPSWADCSIAFPEAKTEKVERFRFSLQTADENEAGRRRDLAIPDDTLVAFHVTSLDVTHSFWAYELGVKADAVPGVDNIAYVKARHTGLFQIRCAELCGLWHGHMSKKGRVLASGAFQSWIAAAKTKNAAIVKYLPKYNRVYFPAPLRRAG